MGKLEILRGEDALVDNADEIDAWHRRQEQKLEAALKKERVDLALQRDDSDDVDAMERAHKSHATQGLKAILAEAAKAEAAALAKLDNE